MTDLAAIDGVRTRAELNQTDQRSGSDELGKTQFLELMIAQLENQDPLDPSKNEEFVAQLAQFSSVEGIENLNNTVDDMAAAIRSSLTLEAASLVSREVLIPSDRGVVTESGLTGQVDLPAGASDVRVTISELSGQRVAEVELGLTEAGSTTFSWDGLNADGEPVPSGLYRLQAVVDRGGESESATLYLPNIVSGVSVGAGGVSVDLLGGEQTTTDDIRQIR
ncbi:MAG: flagellar hook assembly protein FlgD [Pseudomonadota bacterium]